MRQIILALTSEQVRAITILTLMLLPMISQAQRQQYQQVNDIPYTASADAYAQERCKLDVYYPTNQKDAPVVVWFHGGGIEGGSKHIDEQLKNSGLVVVAANYRLLPKAPIDDILDDAAAAVAWTYKNIEKYGGSHRKIFVAGHSAGGYLLDMIGLDKKWLAKYGVDADSLAALVPFSGQCITHYNIRKQQDIPPLQATIDQYAPLTYVRPDAPPIVIISGDRELELYGRYEEQAYFWRMLKLVGHKDVTIYEMQGYDHGSMPQPAYKILKDHIRRLTAKMTSALPLNSASGQSNFENADVNEFAELVADTNVVILDVRTASEFDEGHLERAINIDYNQNDFVEKVKSTMPLDKKIAVYCRSGRRSAGAAGKLGNEDYKLVNLKGGIIAWKEANMPVTTK